MINQALVHAMTVFACADRTRAQMLQAFQWPITILADLFAHAERWAKLACFYEALNGAEYALYERQLPNG